MSLLVCIQDYYYSIDNSCLNLLVKKVTSQNSTLTVPLEVTAENKNLFVWQFIDGQFPCVGWIDILPYKEKLLLNVNFNSCNELVFRLDQTILQFNYCCELPTKEKEKYTKLSSLWKDIRKAKKSWSGNLQILIQIR